jgi:hypothetical protein
MSEPIQRRAPISAAIASALIALVFVGCEKPEQIQTYNAPKEPAAAPVAKAKPAAPTGEATDRMLAAIVPIAGQAYFFKVVGPLAAIEVNEKAISDFFAAIRVADGKPKWQLPEGWKESGASGMRMATITLPAEPKPLEITVNSLPWSGSPADMLSNVNRWRGQLQLPPTDAAHIAENTRDAKAGDLPITIVDLRGHFAGSGMSPPFAGGAGPFSGGAPPFAGGNSGAAPANSNAPPDLPPGHPPIDATAPPSAPPQAVADDAPSFVAPKDWQQLPAGGMRKAAFAVGNQEHGALVTLINFHATEGPQIGDSLQNVNMWRQGVGLQPIKQDELSKHTESIEINGQPAVYARAVPDPADTTQSQANLATLAAMAKQGDQLWFIKFSGDRSVVTAQEDAFKSFLKSLRFAAGSGATDGNK